LLCPQLRNGRLEVSGAGVPEGAVLDVAMAAAAADHAVTAAMAQLAVAVAAGSKLPLQLQAVVGGLDLAAAAAAAHNWQLLNSAAVAALLSFQWQHYSAPHSKSVHCASAVATLRRAWCLASVAFGCERTRLR